MKKIVKVLLILLIPFLIYKLFIYIDIKNQCYIRIIPTFQPSNLDNKRIIKAIRYGSPEDYKNLCAHVNVINKNPSCGGFDGGCFKPDKPKRIFTGSDQGNLALAAAIVVHETCHSIQFQEDRQISEVECYAKGAQFLEKVVLR